MSASSNLVAKLKRRGFDKSRSVDGRARVGCSQCQALAINGVACHETGCPNESKPRERYVVGCGRFRE